MVLLVRAVVFSMASHTNSLIPFPAILVAWQVLMNSTSVRNNLDYARDYATVKMILYRKSLVNAYCNFEIIQFSSVFSLPQIAKFMGPTWGPPGSCRPQGWGLLKLRSLISPLAKFSILQKYLLDSLNHNHIWQVSPQLRCGDPCQISTRYSIANVCFDNNGKCGK